MSILYRSKLKHFYALFLIAAILSSCKEDKKKIDVSNIKLEVHIERFDHDFDLMRNKPMAQQVAVLQSKYGPFYADFIQRILDAGNIADTAYFVNLRQVFAGKPYLDLKHEVDSVYPNLQKQEEELTDAFKRIKYYFPQKQLPKVYAYFSGFQAQTTLGNGYFGIGLDQFLGLKSKFYPALVNTYPHYLSRRFTPDNITPRVIEGMLHEDMFPEADADRSLLAKMVYEGKMLYLMDVLLPDVPDSTKIGYTSQQIQWCQAFEKNIWGYFLEENLLYETDYLKLQKYLNEAPFTPGLGEKNESAPKLAVYTGWQIIRQYMIKHPYTTVQQLLALNDPQKILDDAGYHPK
ncbi:gliding motility lipoprotein GldB [Mucilaginibacter terrae]|uniref:Gliding motility-associated lipoprotein GldB n=1 Tax=Mucilaginibacter terrae TaxID=1955052 RepID=A0ABU3GTB5_9SPHI|nr:gliding motility lipoprotein GldB [Mucilaginibacter terrae]MDT3402806.1 gliding motility-associated lipoprotein GldB [Mucilaginibacter terrae]